MGDLARSVGRAVATPSLDHPPLRHCRPAPAGEHAMMDIPCIPPLRSGGLILTWRCTNACRHCLYRCSPAQPDRAMDAALLERTFAALAREPGFNGLHLAGGEATLDLDLLELALRTAARHGVAIDYLETNAHWCDDETRGRAVFGRLREAGLGAVLISASLYHNEFIPFDRTRAAVVSARATFGTGGVIVWTPQVFSLMQRLPAERTHTLVESCRLLGLDPERGDLHRLHGYVRPAGRAASSLRAGLQRHPAEHFRGERCADVLAATGHIHIAPGGELFTGHCPGIAPGDVDDLHPRIGADTAFATLWHAGPWGLAQRAADEAGFAPDPTGYVSGCDLCFQARKALRTAGRCPDLRPAEAYAP